MSASESRADPPSDRVLEAFGRHGRPQPLSDDRHATWRVGDLVLKPADTSHEQLEWQASLQRRLRDHDGFRMPQAVRSLDGRLLVDGWYAMTFLEGRHEPARWPDIIAVGAVFHDAVADEPVPSFLEQRRDPWSIGDRVAWGAQAAEDLPETKHLDRLLATLAGLDARSQLIHGDLTGNVCSTTGCRPRSWISRRITGRGTSRPRSWLRTRWCGRARTRPSFARSARIATSRSIWSER